MKLWLAQLLCPQRHAILALAYDREETPAAEVEAQLHLVLEARVVNPWCGLCASRELHIEHGKLATDDWDTATRVLRATEQENLATRAQVDRLKGAVN